MAKTKKKDLKKVEEKEVKKLKKQDEPVVEEKEEAPVEAPVKEEEAEAPAEEKAEEEVVEKDEKPEAEAEEESQPKAEAEAEDAEVEDEGDVAKDVDPIEVLKSIKEMSDPKEMKAAINAALKQLTKTDDDGNVEQSSNVALDVVEVLKGFQSQLDHIEEMVKADEPEAEAPVAEEGDEAEAGESEEVSAEADTPTEEAPEAPADTPAEAPEEEPTDGSLEKVAKVEGSLTKLEGEVSGIKETLAELAKTVKTIAEQPVPSKVQSPAVVAKAFEVGDEGKARLKEISEELDKLADLKKNNPEKYQRENKADEAFKLFDERERLQSGLV